MTTKIYVITDGKNIVNCKKIILIYSFKTGVPLRLGKVGGVGHTCM